MVLGCFQVPQKYHTSTTGFFAEIIRARSVVLAVVLVVLVFSQVPRGDQGWQRLVVDVVLVVVFFRVIRQTCFVGQPASYWRCFVGQPARTHSPSEKVIFYYHKYHKYHRATFDHLIKTLNVRPKRHPMSDTQRTQMTDTETRHRADAPAHSWPPICWLWFDPLSITAPMPQTAAGFSLTHPMQRASRRKAQETSHLRRRWRKRSDQIRSMPRPRTLATGAGQAHGHPPSRKPVTDLLFHRWSKTACRLE